MPRKSIRNGTGDQRENHQEEVLKKPKRPPIESAEMSPSKKQRHMDPDKGVKAQLYNGPPQYLLNPHRTDVFANPANVRVEEDGTVRPLLQRTSSDYDSTSKYLAPEYSLTPNSSLTPAKSTRHSVLPFRSQPAYQHLDQASNTTGSHSMNSRTHTSEESESRKRWPPTKQQGLIDKSTMTSAAALRPKRILKHYANKAEKIDKLNKKTHSSRPEDSLSAQRNGRARIDEEKNEIVVIGPREYDEFAVPKKGVSSIVSYERSTKDREVGIQATGDEENDVDGDADDEAELERTPDDSKHVAWKKICE